MPKRSRNGVVSKPIRVVAPTSVKGCNSIRTVRAAVHGFVFLELGGGFGLPDDVEVSFEHLLATLVAGLAETSAGSQATGSRSASQRS